MDEQKKNAGRQITLHFDEETVKVLEHFEGLAKHEMRTTEAQMLWFLRNNLGQEEK